MELFNIVIKSAIYLYKIMQEVYNTYFKSKSERESTYDKFQLI